MSYRRRSANDGIAGFPDALDAFSHDFGDVTPFLYQFQEKATKPTRFNEIYRNCFRSLVPQF
jgi:hypothetical protein